MGSVVQIVGAGLCEVELPDGRITIHEDELEVVPQDPATSLVAGELGSSKEYELRLRALLLRHAYRYDPMSGLSNARIEPALHQVYVAHRVTRKMQPRMILADEVGLGKTVEAGLIIKELKARGLVERVLIVAPASLLLQWQQEMRSKFNEEFEIIDGDAERHLGRGDRNAFRVYHNVICSLPFASNPRRTENLIGAGWDLVVFDEAHRVRRSLNGRQWRATQAYKMADELKESVDGLLMLTATPMQLGAHELYSTIELVEPGLFPSLDAFERRRTEMPVLNELVASIGMWSSLDEAARASVVAQLAEYLGDDSQMALERGLDDAESRAELIGALEARHPLASVMIRNRKSVLADVGQAVGAGREAQSFLVPQSELEAELYEDITKYIRSAYDLANQNKNKAIGFVMVNYQRMLTSSSFALRASMLKRIEGLKAALAKTGVGTARTLTAEELAELFDAEEGSDALDLVDDAVLDATLIKWEIAQLESFVGRLRHVADSKAGKLVEILDTLCVDSPDEKVLIFTQFKETQAYLQDVLQRNDYSVAVFHGGLKPEEKEAAVRTFKGAKQVLISTESGGEGRNFQFAHVMVNYDLPWNPMRVEQRIGRLDRMGQKKRVLVYNLAYEGTLEERVLDVLEHRIRVFTESVGSLDPILGSIERDIERIVMEHAETLDEEFERLDRSVESAMSVARDKEVMFADFILDRASFRMDEADGLLGATAMARFTDLRAYCTDVLDYHGGFAADHVEGGMTLSLSRDLAHRLGSSLHESWGHFDPAEARAREDLDFFAFGHPMVDGLVRLGVESDSMTGVLRSDSGAAGAPSIDVYYELEHVGVKPGGRLIRHSVGPDLNVAATELRVIPALTAAQGSYVVPDWVEEAMASSREAIAREHLAERARVQEENERLRQEALDRQERLLAYRRLRLERAIEADQQWIDEKRVSGSEKDLRVMAAREGKLRKNQERLETLLEEHEATVEDIMLRQASVTARVLAAGLVV